jgi:hypothetical protein
MKQFRNATLAILGGLVMLSVATVSCSKKSGGSSPSVTITNVAPNPATTGSTVTVTGTGFTSPATVSINGGAAITGAVNGAGTQITFTAPAATSGALSVTTNGQTVAFTGGTFTVNAAPVGPTSDSIAPTNLIAHWTFDGSSIEAKSNVSANTGGNYNVGTVAYTNAGVIGNCATFTNGALVFPYVSTFADTALESYTISLWVKLGDRGTSPRWQSLFQLNSNAYTGLFGILGVQVLNKNAGDTLPLQITQSQLDGTAPYTHTGGFGSGADFNNSNINLTNVLVYKANSASGWTLLTTTYDGTLNNQTLTQYANGVQIGQQTLTTVTKPGGTQTTFRIAPTGGTDAGAPPAWHNYVTIGTFNFYDFPEFQYTTGYGTPSIGNNTPVQASLNAGPTGYMGNGISGSIDDIRVFNTALTAAQVTTLYTYGTQGK